MRRLFFTFPHEHDRSRRPRLGARPKLEGLEARIQLSLVAASGADFKINQTASVGQTLPSVAMDANGDFVVAWGDQTGTYAYNIDARVYNSAGQPQTGEIVVAQTTGVPRPSVAMDANGDFVVAWQVFDENTFLYGVSAKRYNLAGTQEGGTITLNDGSSRTRHGRVARGRDGLRRRFRSGLARIRLQHSGCLREAIQFVRGRTRIDLCGEHGHDGQSVRSRDRDGFGRRFRDRLAGRRPGPRSGNLRPKIHFLRYRARKQHRDQHHPVQPQRLLAGQPIGRHGADGRVRHRLAIHADRFGYRPRLPGRRGPAVQCQR